MRLQPHTKTFTRSVTDAIAPVIRKSTTEDREVINQRLMAALLSDPEPPVGRLPKVSRDEHFAIKMFRAYAEIFGCIERLRDCETYVSRYPFRGTRVSRAAYLQLVVEIHLHELYILQQRLQAWLTQIERGYRNDSRAAAVKKFREQMTVDINASLGALVSVRGGHVHESRYENADIARLRLIDILSTTREKDLASAMRQLRRSAIQDTHGRLKKQANNWNRIVSDLLERFFSGLASILFAGPGAGFQFPTPKK